MGPTVADWITAAFTAVLAVVTLVLAIATARYVTQTRCLVDETKKSREEAERGSKQSAEDNRLTREEMAASREETHEARLQSVRPRLALSLLYRGPTMAFVQVKNVGQGPALEVDIELAFEPAEGGTLPREVRRWRFPLVAPGEDHWFAPSYGEGGGLLDVHGLAAAFDRLTLTGTIRDTLGDGHRVDERIEDLPGYRDLNRRAAHIWQQEEPARTLTEKVGDPITKELRELAQTIDRSAGRLVLPSENGQDS